MRTDDLIDKLTAHLPPVHRLRSPPHRTLVWLAVSLLYVMGAVAVIGVRPDIAAKLQQPRFLFETGAALATGVLAAMAAYCAGCPGRPSWERAAPLPALALWLGVLAHGIWASWMRSGLDELELLPDFECLQSIMLFGALPGVLIFAMIRRAAPLAPATSGALAALAAASLGAAGLRFFHPQDASLMVLVWQVGSVALFAALGSLLGRLLLRWQRPLVA